MLIVGEGKWEDTLRIRCTNLGNAGFMVSSLAMKYRSSVPPVVGIQDWHIVTPIKVDQPCLKGERLEIAIDDGTFRDCALNVEVNVALTLLNPEDEATVIERTFTVFFSKGIPKQIKQETM